MPSENAPVAQLDRALDYESRGQEFESLRARHFRIAKLVASAARWQPSSSFGTLGEFLAGNLHRLLHDGIAAIGSEVEKGFEHLLTARARIE